MPRRPAHATDRPATYRQVFAAREFRYVLTGNIISMLGDELLRVALALLLYHDTHSPLLTAVGYALTFLPWVVAGPLLSRYADRAPRRQVIVGGSLARGAVVGLMAIPHVPIALLLTLVFVAESVSPPVSAASHAVLPEILTGDGYVLGLSLSQACLQAAQIAGFGLGGATVAVVGARAGFAIDAGSFVVVAVLSQVGLQHPYAPLEVPEASSWWADTRQGFAEAVGRPGPRALLLISWWAAAVLLVPEALAAPFVTRTTHGGDQATGWLLTAQPAGMILGLFVIGRVVRPSLRQRLVRPLALLAPVPLIAFAVRPSYPLAVALIALAGVAWSFQAPLQAQFVGQIPPSVRGRVFGVAASGFQVAQGLGVLIGGALAEVVGVSPAIAAAGVVGVLVMVGLVSLPTPAAASQEPVPVAAS